MNECIVAQGEIAGVLWESHCWNGEGHHNSTPHLSGRVSGKYRPENSTVNVIAQCHILQLAPLTPKEPQQKGNDAKIYDQKWISLLCK